MDGDGYSPILASRGNRPCRFGNPVGSSPGIVTFAVGRRRRSLSSLALRAIPSLSGAVLSVFVG
jgi:hypothetical protein